MIKKIVSLAMAIASRGFDNNKIDENTKRLRVVSCFGMPGFSQCPKLKKSNNSEYSYCGGCGCGDHPHTWLLKGKNEYAKLDYPVLKCPLKMPGFSNYDPNYIIDDNRTRRDFIENMSPESLSLVQITVNSNPQMEHDINIVKNIIKNS
jgi:hypothetical protein